MGYIVSAIALGIAFAALQMLAETSQEYVAQYVVENESGDFGAPTEAAAVDAASQAGAPGAPAQAEIGRVQPILFDGAALTAATLGAVVPEEGAPEETADPAIVPAAAAVSGAPDLGWLDIYRHAGASEIEPASLEDEAAQARLGISRDTPHRRPDGTVFLPISSQRLFELRSMVTRIEDIAVTWEIPGRVTTNAATGTMVTAPRAGIVEAVDGQFPYLGREVMQGELLAYLRPHFAASERAQIEARIQQLIALISLNSNQIDRLEEVLFIRYRANKIAALKVEMEGHRRELETLQSALADRHVLRAMADGVISGVEVVANAMVAQGDPIFQVVDPDELWVEASAFDPAIAGDVRDAAALTADGRAVALEFVGGGLTMDHQAIPLRFRVVGGGEGLTVGAPVTVIVRGSETLEAIPVPASSVTRDSDGRALVWERVSAERFLPRYVQTRRLGGDTVAVVAGLSNGLRIVTSGAAVLAQVR